MGKGNERPNGMGHVGEKRSSWNILLQTREGNEDLTWFDMKMVLQMGDFDFLRRHILAAVQRGETVKLDR